MTKVEEKRLTDIEDVVKELVEGQKALEKAEVGLKGNFEGYRAMQNERQDRTDEALRRIEAGQENLVQWHIKNLQAVKKSRTTVTSVSIAAVLAVAAIVSLIMKYAG